MVAKKGLYLHFMSVILPMIVLVFILIIAVFEWSNYEKSQQDLSSKLNNLATTYSLLLSEAVAKEDVRVLQYFNVFLITDPDISYIIIKNSRGRILAEYGDASTQSEKTTMQRTVNINYSSSGVNRIVGTLSLGLTSEQINQRLERQIRYELILLLALIIIVLISVRIAYVYAIGRPLASLTRSIEKFRETGVHTPASVSEDDELGTVITTYNTMQLQQIAIRKELTQHQQNLEKLVEQRTQALEKELQSHALTATKLFNEKQRVQVTLDSITDPVITTDVSGNIKYMNPAACGLTQLSKEDAKNINLARAIPFLNVETGKPIADIGFNDDTQKSDLSQAREYYLNVDGKQLIVEMTTSAINDEAGNLSGVAVLIRDITESVKRTSELSYLAQHDMLTGLVNRREFETQLGVLLEDSRMNNSRHVLFYLDLDHFKVINDQCGHAAGDDVLKRLSTEFKNHLRKGDIIGRLGGDEFGVLLVNCDLENASILAEKMRADIDNFEFQWGNRVFKLGVSIGMVAVDNTGESVEVLIEKADSSCYAAKQNGRNTVHLHEAGT